MRRQDHRSIAMKICDEDENVIRTPNLRMTLTKRERSFVTVMPIRDDHRLRANDRFDPVHCRRLRELPHNVADRLAIRQQFIDICYDWIRTRDIQHVLEDLRGIADEAKDRTEIGLYGF